jgi:hypothetical protein
VGESRRVAPPVLALRSQCTLTPLCSITSLSSSPDTTNPGSSDIHVLFLPRLAIRVSSNTTKHSVPVNSISIFGMVSASHCPTRSRATAGTTPPRLASLVPQYDDVAGSPASKQRPDQLQGRGLVALRTLIPLQAIG